MAFELTPEEHELGELLLSGTLPIGLSENIDEHIASAGLTRPMDVGNIESIAWKVGYTFAHEAPFYMRAVAIDLGERLAVRFTKNLGWSSVESDDLVTATNCVTFLGRASLQGKYEAFFLEKLINKWGKKSLEYELQQIVEQDD